MKVPLARYSRDEIAVVNGGTGSWLSSLAPRVSVQPSGVLIVAGTPDGTRPSVGDVVSAAGAASGSAPAEGALVADMTMQTASTAARRSTTADTVNTGGVK